MKKTLCILTLLFSTFSVANAQSNNIKLNIFSPFVRTGSLFYERQVTTGTSAQLGVFFTRFNIGDTKFSGIGVTPEYHFYVGGEALKGFYLGPYLRFQRFSVSKDMENASGQTVKAEGVLKTYGGGVIAGYQFVLGKHFTIDPFLGVGYDKYSLDLKAGRKENLDVGTFNGISLRPGLNIGYAF